MRVSEKRLDPETKKEIFGLLYQVIADLKSPKEAEVFLSDLLSDHELMALAKRLAAAYYLQRDYNYENIKDDLKLSSATIANIEKEIKSSKGFKLALERIEAEKWAGEWNEKIKRLFKS